MDCGIPFCHDGCPLGNLIPEWNDLAWRDDWQAAIERLHATNNFPEFTGRLCPAPCEGSCVLGINSDPVTIKQVEVSIIDRAWDEGWVQPQPPERLTGRTVAVVGSGPAGLAAAQQLTRAGHTVVVLERADAVGGLLRYGIPEFKMEKRQLDRRVEQMRAEGTRFSTGVDVGGDITADALRAKYDAVVLAIGATAARDLPVPGRELDGVLQAMEYLPHANRAALDPAYEVPVSRPGEARGHHRRRRHRRRLPGHRAPAGSRVGHPARDPAAAGGRAAEHQPLADLAADLPHLERARGGRRAGLRREHQPAGGRRRRPGRAARARRGRAGGGPVRAGARARERAIPAELVLLAMGFLGPQQPGLVEQLGVDLDPRGNVARDGDFMTSVPGVFVAGDAGRGQSLIVWAIAEGRAAAAGVDAWLQESSSTLPRPIEPTARPVSV